jgi:phosphoglycolate phosphatase
MRVINSLIFDLDGTLVDSSSGVIEAVNYALMRTGQAQRSPETIRKYIGYPLESMFSDFTDIPYQELLEHFRVKARETVVPATTALDGADEALERLHRLGYRMAIATTKIKTQVDGIIIKLGWQSYFSVAIGGDEVRRVKPDPEIFLLALRQLKTDPGAALVIGDTVNDVLSARAAGVDVVGVASRFGDHQEMLDARPDYLIQSISELAGLMETLEKRGLQT